MVLAAIPITPPRHHHNSNLAMSVRILLYLSAAPKVKKLTNCQQPRETVVIEPTPPAYPGGYGTIEVHHHHHHTLRARGPRGSCCRALAVTLLILLAMTTFSVVCFVAWNFYNLSECEKDRMPWDKPCRDWLGKDSILWGNIRT